MGLTSQGLTPDEKARYARMSEKSPRHVEELRRQIIETAMQQNQTLVETIATEIRTKILNDPLLKKDAGIE
jgi:hypothetical protein